MSQQSGLRSPAPSLVQLIRDIINFVRLPRVPFWLSSITDGPKACSTIVNVSISFGGRLWPMNPADMNIGPLELDSSQCLGAIYTSSNTTQPNGTANWIFGTAFMVSFALLRPNDKPDVVLNYIEKCVQRLPADPVFDRVRRTVDSVFQQPFAFRSAETNSGLRSGRRGPFFAPCVLWKKRWKHGGGHAQVGMGTGNGTG